MGDLKGRAKQTGREFICRCECIEHAREKEREKAIPRFRIKILSFDLSAKLEILKYIVEVLHDACFNSKIRQ